MRRLLIRNPDLTGVEKTNLTSAYSTGVTLSVISTFAFAANDLVSVGNQGEEKSEVKKVSAVASDTSLTLASALKFSHPKDTPIYRISWDQVEISSKTTGAWSVVSTSGLQYDKNDTVYVDATGSAETYYRWRFNNSVTSAYSEFSPTFSGAGFTEDQAGYMSRNIRKVSGAGINVISDTEIVRALNQAQDIVYAVRADWWFLKFEDAVGIATQEHVFRYNLDTINSGVAGTPSTATTLGYVDTVLYRYNDGTTDQKYRLRYKPEAEFDELITDANRQPDDWVTCYTIRPADSSSINGYMEVYPTPDTASRGTFYVKGFTQVPALVDDIDKTPIPLPSILENFALSYIERIRGNDKKADYYEELFYGPAPTLKDNRRLTGIALLEQLQKRSEPVGQPKSLVRFQGQKAMSRLYGNTAVPGSRDDIHTNYW